MRRTIAVVLTAASIFAGASGINWRTANGMTACWNSYGPQIDILAQRHQVSQSLAVSLVYWESGCRESAVRFEPGVYRWPAVIRMAKGNDAERRFLSSSFGLAQVLGVTARGMGYAGGHEEFKIRSLEYGMRYLAGKHRQYGNWDDALRAYNGGHGAVVRRKARVEAYVVGVNALRERYGKKIVSEWLKRIKEARET